MALLFLFSGVPILRCSYLALSAMLTLFLYLPGHAKVLSSPKSKRPVLRQTKTQSTRKIVQIDAGNVSFPAYIPLESLAGVLDKYPNAPRFHLSWTSSGGRHFSKSNVLYDRTQHRLYFHCEVHAVPWGDFHRSSVFRGVTDAILKQDAAAHKNSKRELPYDDQLDVIFDDLTAYGCQRSDLPSSNNLSIVHSMVIKQTTIKQSAK